MGSRGPVRGTGGRPLGGRAPSSPVVLPTLLPSRPAEPPDPPAGLREAGLALWESVWQSIPWVTEGEHGAVVAELCRVHDEIDLYRRELEERGPLLAEPILSPQGFVAGEKMVPNPCEAMLRRADATAERLWAALGLTPAAKLRLGLDHLAARRQVQTIALRQRKAAGT